MNDLKGILLLIFLAVPLIAATNIDCSGKGFHCVNSTHFMICVDLGNGVSTTIDDFVIPCPPTTVCDKHNIFECDYPKIEISTLAPLQVISVSTQSDTSATNSVNYNENTTTLPEEVLGLLHGSVIVTTLPIPEEVKSEVNFKQDSGPQGESTKGTAKTVPGFTTNVTVFVNNNQSNERIENSFASATDTLIDPISSTDSTSFYTDVIIPYTPLDLISTDAKSVKTRTNKYFDKLNSFDIFNTDSVITTLRYNMEQVSENGTHNELVTDEVNMPNKKIFINSSIVANKNTPTSSPEVNTYTQSFDLDDINNKTILNISSDKVYQNDTEWNSIGSNTKVLVLETNTRYLAPNKSNFTSESVREVGSQLIAERNFVTSNDISNVVDMNSFFDVTTLKPLLNTARGMNTINSTNMTKHVMDTNDINENVTEKITTSKGLDITPTLYGTTNYDTNNNINDNIKFDLVNSNFAELTTTGKTVTTEQVSQGDTKYFTHDTFSSILDPSTDFVGLQITTEKTFTPLEIVDLFSNESQSIKDINLTSGMLSFSNQLSNNSVQNTQVKNTDGRNKNEIVLSVPEENIVIAEITSTNENVYTDPQTVLTDVIKIETNLNIQNNSAYQNYTKLNSVRDVTTKDSNKNEIELVSEPVILVTLPEITTDKNFPVITDKLILPNKNVLTERFINTSEINTTEKVNMNSSKFKIQIFNVKNNSNLQQGPVKRNNTDFNSISEVSTTEPVPKNSTDSTNLVWVPDILDFVPQTTTEKTLATSGVIDKISYGSQSDISPSTSSLTDTLQNAAHEQTNNMVSEDKNVTVELIISKENIFGEGYIIADKINNSESIPCPQNYDTDNEIHKNNSINQNAIEKTKADVTTTQPATEVSTPEPVIKVVDSYLTTETNFVTSGFSAYQIEPSTSSSFNTFPSSNVLFETTTTELDQNFTNKAIDYGKHIEHVSDKIITLNESDSEKRVTMDIINSILENTSFKNDVTLNKINLDNVNNQVNQNFEEQRSVGDISIGQTPKTINNYFTSVKSDSISELAVNSQTTIIKAFVDPNTKANLTNNWSLNDLLVNGNANTAYPYGIAISTDSAIELTGYLYQRPDKASTEINNGTASINTIETLETTYYPSSSFNDKVSHTQEISFIPPTTENSVIEILTLRSSQNKSIEYKMEDFRKESPVSIKKAIIHKTQFDEVSRYINTTLTPQNSLLKDATTNILAENSTLKSDTLSISTINITSDISSYNKDTHERDGKAFIKAKENIDQSKLNGLYNMDILNETFQSVEQTTLRNNVENIVTTALYPLDVTENITPTNSINPIIVNSNMLPSETVNISVDSQKNNLSEPPSSNLQTLGFIPIISDTFYTPPIGDSIQSKQNNITEKIIPDTVPVADYKMVTKIILSLDVTHKSNATAEANRVLTAALGRDTLTTSENVASNIEEDRRNQGVQPVFKQLNDLLGNSPTTEPYLPDQNVKKRISSLINVPTEPMKKITTENYNSLVRSELPSRISEFDHTIPKKYFAIENSSFPNRIVGVSTEHVKLNSEVTETVSSGLTLNSTDTTDNSTIPPVYRIEGMNKMIDLMSATQFYFPHVKTSNIKNTIIDQTQEAPIHSLSLNDTQTIEYNNPESVLPILENPPLLDTGSTTEYLPTTLLPTTKTQKVLAGAKDLLLDLMLTGNYKNTHSISATSETVLNLETVPGSTVQTISTENEDKISGNQNFGINSYRQVMPNSGNVINKTVINVDNKNVVNITSSKLNTHNITITFRNDTENNLFQAAIKKEDVEKVIYPLNNIYIEEESTSKSSVLKRDIDHKNILPTELPRARPIVQINSKTTKNVNDVQSSIKTGTVNMPESELASSKNITELSDSLQNRGTILSSVKQVGANSENRSDTQYFSSTLKNMTRASSTLSLHNSSFNNNLKQHLISTNHTVATELQHRSNKNAKQSNKTSNELKLSKVGMQNPNLVFNSENENKITINVSASLFDCSNQTRGKYADKKDCRKFYFCVGKLQPLTGTCPENTVFSEINKQCTRNLSHCVRNNQFRCLYEGRFSDFFRENVYYICVKNKINGFLRYTLQCEDGYHLNKFSVKCEKNEDITSQSASSLSDNSKINNDNSKESTKNNSPIDFECEDEGTFPNEKDCRKYYVCTKRKDVYRRRIKKCSSDEVYDKKKQKCVEADSSEC